MEKTYPAAKAGYGSVNCGTAEAVPFQVEFSRSPKLAGVATEC